MLYYADVILPLALDRPYTYAVEKQDFLFLKPGFRVAVSFGKSKVYTGVIIKLHNLQPQRYTPKFIEFILEDSPSISKRQLELWQWISEYYHCKLGEVMRAAFPATFLLESETVIVKKEFEDDKSKITDEEYLVYEALEYKSLTINEIIEIIGRKNVLGLIHNMFTKGYIDLHQKIAEKYKPKKIRFARFPDSGP